MKAEDFLAFLTLMKWSDAEAMRQLGVGSHNTLANYKQNGGPLWLGLACAALARGLPPWKDTHVKVYAVSLWQQQLGENVRLESKRTAEAIASIQGATAIPGTEETVDASDIDQLGRYVRVAAPGQPG